MVLHTECISRERERIAWEPWPALVKESWIDQMWTRMLEPLKPVWAKVMWLNTHFVSYTIVIGCGSIMHCGFHCREVDDQSFPLAHLVETGMLCPTSHPSGGSLLFILSFWTKDESGEILFYSHFKDIDTNKSLESFYLISCVLRELFEKRTVTKDLRACSLPFLKWHRDRQLSYTTILI